MVLSHESEFSGFINVETDIATEKKKIRQFQKYRDLI